MATHLSNHTHALPVFLLGSSNCDASLPHVANSCFIAVVLVIRGTGISRLLRDAGLVDLKSDPLLDPLRQKPHFQAIEQELKFPS